MMTSKSKSLTLIAAALLVIALLAVRSSAAAQDMGDAEQSALTRQVAGVRTVCEHDSNETMRKKFEVRLAQTPNGIIMWHFIMLRLMQDCVDEKWNKHSPSLKLSVVLTSQLEMLIITQQ